MKKTTTNNDQIKPAMLEIKNCSNCPFFSRKRIYTADSWEDGYDWFCEKSNNKKIAGFVEWNEASMLPVPAWCPLRG